MQSKYQKQRNTRGEARHSEGSFKAGKLFPVMAQAVLGSESGALTQRAVLELDPIPGRLRTDITGEIIAVYVPALAADMVKNPNDQYVGNAEVFREKLIAGTVFDLEDENKISKLCAVNPRSINGVKKVNEITRFAYIAAINYLRQKKYDKAETVDKTLMDVTPALIGRTVLQRLNAVLDPEDRVNGQVKFDIQQEMPVRYTGDFTAENNVRSPGFRNPKPQDPDGDYTAESVDGTSRMYSLLNTTSQLSLTDLWRADRIDALTREMREIKDKNPEFGPELIQRYAHGLSMDMGKFPFVMYRREVVFGDSMVRAMDGANLDKVQTNNVAAFEFTVPVPKDEFGGVIITFLSVKPDETLAYQPHPILSDVWGGRNFVADEMDIDPQPVTIRELNSECTQGEEATIACYNGKNHLLKTYQQYGFNRDQDMTQVENKVAIWQLQVPMSVTPQTVLYPDDLPQTPFAVTDAEVCKYSVSSVFRCDTPLFFGPKPVEELAEIEDDDIFEDAPQP